MNLRFSKHTNPLPSSSFISERVLYFIINQSRHGCVLRLPIWSRCLGLLNTHDSYRLYHTEYAVLCPVLSYLLQLLWPDRSQKEICPGHSWVNRITINYSLRVWSPDGMLTPATRAVLFMIPFHICCLCVHLCFDIYMSIAKRPIDEFVDI